MNIIKLSIILLSIALSSCNEDITDKKSSTKNGHIWQTQTDALQKTKDLATKLNEEFNKKEQQMREAQQ